MLIFSTDTLHQVELRHLQLREDQRRAISEVYWARQQTRFIVNECDSLNHWQAKAQHFLKSVGLDRGADGGTWRAGFTMEWPLEYEVATEATARSASTNLVQG